jgi:cholesterol oxidase
MATEQVDAVVVGSGFGGSVTTWRLAEAGRRVVMLERGKPYPPGSFPRTPWEMSSSFWDPSEGHHGLYDAWSFSGLGAVVSSGLGGGSLIYANVLLRKDERWFVREDLAKGGHEYWPVTRQDLDPHYDRVERMLAGTPYPWADETPKTAAFRSAARGLGLEWSLPNLAVTFAPTPGAPPVKGEPIVEREPNLHRRTRLTCRLCAECNIGCNFGSKNTLDYNYLSAAARLGADLRTRCEVRSFAPAEGGGWVVRYVRHRPEAEGRPTRTRELPLEEIRCKALVLAAGAIGTPFLLLANRPALPGISARLGTRFSGNGDLLTFALRSGGAHAQLLEASHGTVITSYLRVPDAADGGSGRGYYVEDAGYPQFVSWILQLADTGGLLARLFRLLRFYWRRLRLTRSRSRLGPELVDLFGACGLSKGSLPMLGMGRDIPDGKLFLAGERRLEADWHTASSREYFERVRDTMRSVSGALGARFVDDPIWYLSRVITVHPLGGSPMGRNAGEGVVDAWGEVFGHPGLFVADGSVMPGPVGANPALTIAALADRFAERICERAR